MKNTNILISGASIAGPALAFWLRRYGFNPTVVERAAALREGGQAVDFRGPAHMHVLERMGILDSIRQVQTHMQDVAIVDGAGKRLVTLPSQLMSGEVELQRGDLSRILYDATNASTEYIFDDCITSLDETTDGVNVTFERSTPRTFDLVIGADGLHSGVRALAFGDESRFIRFHGYYVAGFTAPNSLKLDHTGLIHSVPGRAVSVSSARRRDEATVTFIFASKQFAYDRRDTTQQKTIVSDTYATMGWEVPRFIEAMWNAPDLYFDSISQVDLDHFSTGRVALLGDAGYGGTLGGQGTGLAIVCSYVLAGELALAGGDYRVAFPRYEERIRDYAKTCQKGAKRVGEFYAPRTRPGTWFRNQMYRLLTAGPMTGLFDKLITGSASSITLQEYPSG